MRATFPTKLDGGFSIKKNTLLMLFVRTRPRIFFVFYWISSASLSGTKPRSARTYNATEVANAMEHRSPLVVNLYTKPPMCRAIVVVDWFLLKPLLILNLLVG